MSKAVFFLLMVCIKMADGYIFGDIVDSVKQVFKRQSAYICGTDPYRFYSDYPCNYYAMCTNGGFSVNVGCNTNATCQIYNPNYVCINQCCCTQPQVYQFTQPPTALPFFDSSSNMNESFKILVLLCIILNVFFIV
jgi:hypothetical protein